MRAHGLLVALAWACALTPARAIAQSGGEGPAFPTRPVRVLTTDPAVDPHRGLARVVAGELARSWRATVAVDDREDRTAAQAVQSVARAYADGYTLLFATARLAIGQALKSPPGLDLARELLPVTTLARAPLVVLVRAGGGPDSATAMLASTSGRAQPLAAGFVEPLGVGHLAGAALAGRATPPAKLARIRSASLLAGELAAGRIDFAVVAIVEAMPHLRTGALRALALTTRERSPLLPEVPALAEAGMNDLDLFDWLAVLVPVRTPGPIVARIANDAASVVHLPEARDRLTALGVEGIGDSQRESAAFVAAELRRWAILAARAGARSDPGR